MAMMGGMGGGGMGFRAVAHSVRADQSVKNAHITRETYARVFQFAKPHRRLIVAFLIATIASSVIVVATPLLIQHIIDDGIVKHNGKLILWLAIAMLAVRLVSGGLGILGGYLSALVGESLIYDLRTAVFGHVQRQSLAFFTRTQTGALVSRLNNDVSGAQSAFTSTLGDSVSNTVTVVAIGITTITLSWQVTVLCLVTFPLLLVVSRWVSGRITPLTREQMDGNADMGAMMTERFNVSGAMLSKLFGRREVEDATFAVKADRVRIAGVKIALTMRIFMNSMGTIPQLATVLVYGVGGYLAMNGHLSIGTLTALATLLLQLLVPLQGLAGIRVSVMTALVSFERIFEVLDLPSLIQEKPGADPLPRAVFEGGASVEFDHVAFTYPSSDEISLASLEVVARAESAPSAQVLRDITFTAEPGQMIALVGHSGAGKTTITHLVTRLYDPTNGAVRIGGADLRDVTLQSIADAVGYVTQDAHLWHDTIRANLQYAKPDASDERMWAALEAGQIADLVRRLPDGLDTVVGDRGYRLSGGERQRLAIARILLKAPAIVVLDEATAHLDSESEVAVQRALDTALAGRTSIVIAHRLSTILGADQILVVESGRIAEAGTHDELLARDGVYAELYRTQFARGDESAVEPLLAD